MDAINLIRYTLTLILVAIISHKSHKNVITQKEISKHQPFIHILGILKLGIFASQDSILSENISQHRLSKRNFLWNAVLCRPAKNMVDIS